MQRLTVPSSLIGQCVLTIENVIKQVEWLFCRYNHHPVASRDSGVIDWYGGPSVYRYIAGLQAVALRWSMGGAYP